MRPSSITIHLLADGKEIETKTVTAAENWEWTFPDLPEYKEGSETEKIVYSITEDPVSGYKTVIDGYNVTNIIVSQFYGYNLYLKGRITLNAYLFVPQKELQDPGIYITMNGERHMVSGTSTRKINGRTHFVFPIEMDAKQYNDTVNFRLYGSGGNLLTLYLRDERDITETGWTYSVQAYIDRVLKLGDNDPLLQELMVAMNDYGSYVQEYFNYNMSNRASIKGSSGSVTLSDLEDYKKSVVYPDEDNKGVTYESSELFLNSDTVIRHYFSISGGSVGDYTFTVKGETVTPKQGDKGYYVEIKDVYARHLGIMYAVTVSNSDGLVLTLRYSALSYAYDALNGGDAAFANVAKAMYLYFKKAESYFDLEG